MLLPINVLGIPRWRGGRKWLGTISEMSPSVFSARTNNRNPSWPCITCWLAPKYPWHVEDHIWSKYSVHITLQKAWKYIKRLFRVGTNVDGRHYFHQTDGLPRCGWDSVICGYKWLISPSSSEITLSRNQVMIFHKSPITLLLDNLTAAGMRNLELWVTWFGIGRGSILDGLKMHPELTSADF